MTNELEFLKKYNFWQGIFPNLGFARADYLDKISNFINNKLIKVLVGQRRAGKSYILRQIIKSLTEKSVNPKNILYISKEFTDFDFIKTYKDLESLVNLYKKEIKPQGRIYLFIDEIQNIEGWEKLINSYSQDFAENYEIFISGSNSKMLSGELATLLSGRYVQFEILPFSFEEYAGFTQKEISKQSYLSYLQSGALPELFSFSNEEAKRNYISSVKDTVFLRDIIERRKVAEPKLLEDIFAYLINNSASLVSIANIVNFFKSKNRKTTYDTVANYIGYMQDAFLIHKAERYNIRGKETIAGNSKYYMNDLAYKNYLYSGFGLGIGYQLENLIYLELRRAGFAVYVGYLGSKEVDFAAVNGGRIIYLQSAYLLADADTALREYGALEKIKDNYEKYVVSLDDVNFGVKDGIKHLQAWNLKNILKP
ncbi:MAG: ATP-binding protein [Elusimicrobiota bacterium]|jgi:predicted AAA+ superfamily ATPase|nr:ATP-binding protein [Elusimicrobiota bacterium]